MVQLYQTRTMGFNFVSVIFLSRRFHENIFIF
jgi:hypothetical protein